MKAVVRSIRSPDLDLETYQPDDWEDVDVFVEVTVGFSGMRGEEHFTVTVVTPKALARIVEADGPTSGRHLFVVARWEWPMVEAALEHLFEHFQTETIERLVELLARYAHWDSED